MNNDPVETFLSQGDKAREILESIPGLDSNQISHFMAKVIQALSRVDDQISWLESKPSASKEFDLIEQFVKNLKRAENALVKSGSDGVIHQHFFLNEGVALAQTSIFGNPVQCTLQALQRAARMHQRYDIDKSSKLNPAKRKYMPLLFHVGQAWKACFWTDVLSTPPINANSNSAFFRFTEFLIVDVIGDRHHRNESLIRTAIKENLLPSK